MEACRPLTFVPNELKGLFFGPSKQDRRIGEHHFACPRHCVAQLHLLVVACQWLLRPNAQACGQFVVKRQTIYPSARGYGINEASLVGRLLLVESNQCSAVYDLLRLRDVRLLATAGNQQNHPKQQDRNDRPCHLLASASNHVPSRDSMCAKNDSIDMPLEMPPAAFM